MTCTNCNVEDGHAAWCVHRAELQEAQAAADKRYRENYARQAFCALKTDLIDRVKEAQGEINHFQRDKPEAHSTLIRDYGISLEKLINHIARMEP